MSALPPDPLPGLSDRRMALAREWNGLVRQVRRKGFPDFLQPPTLAHLLPAAEAGPVVLVNISDLRCDGLLVTRDGVEVVELAVTADDVRTRTNAYLRVIHEQQIARRMLFHAIASTGGPKGGAGRAVLNDLRVRVERQRVSVEQVLALTLEWLWDDICEPILRRLGFGPAQQLPRLWWCPTGALNLLPLHAAGYHTTPDESVMNRVISSYTPTLRILTEARKRPMDTAPERMLIVALPNVAGEMELPNVKRERDLLAQHFPGDGHTLLEGPDARRETVRRQLSRHRWVHLSCHGDQNLADPSQGGLLLHDGLLTVADIGSGRHAGEFAFLSACKTATGGVRLPDEAITLAAALHYTGYRHVIATLWSVLDKTAADLTHSVYAAMVNAGRLDAARSAQALHQAVRHLRDLHPHHPSVWTPFTHTGP